MRISDCMNITNEEVDKMKKEMKDGETIILYSDEHLECKLMKINKKPYEIVMRFGDADFKDIFKEMIKIRYGYN